MPADTQPLSQYQNFTIKKLSQNEGLSQGSNYFLHEDKLGYMWITANDALNRYDGSWVKVYKEQRYFKSCPVLKQGYCFEEDDESNIYVGSSIGLYKYNRKEDAFSLIKVFSGYEDENCIPFAFHNNKIWCYNRFYAIASIDVTSGKTFLYKDVKTEPIQSIHMYMFFQTNYRYRHPFFDKSGMLWITTNSEVVAYNVAKRSTRKFLQHEAVARNLKFTSDYYDSTTNCLIAGTDKGIFLFDVYKQTATFVNSIEGKLLGHVENIKKINEDYVIGNQIELIVVSKDFNKRLLLSNSNQQLETSISTSFFVDKHDRLWICKSGFGLSILKFNDATFLKGYGFNKDPNYFNKKGTHSFAEYPDGDLLIRSGAKLFIKKNAEKNIFSIDKYTEDVSSLPLKNDYNRNGIWLCINGKIALLDCQTNTITLTINSNKNIYGDVQDITVFPSGNVWVALSSGVYTIDFEKKILIPISTLHYPNVFKINLLNKSQVAISYLNNDMLLVTLNEGNNPIVVCKILPGVRSFYLQQNTNNKKYWLGADDGVYLLNEKFKIERKFNASSGLNGSYIYGLLIDKKNNVWVSHEKGLSSINTKNFCITNYDEDDNIQDRDYNNRSFFETKDGTLYFGGIKGFNSFKPPVIIHSFYKPQLYIDDIKVNDKEAFTDTNYTYVRELKLTPHQNKINIHAVVKDLDIIHSNEIIYRFKNLDTVWQHLPASSNIIFNNLAAGFYKLELGYYNTKQKIPFAQKIIAITISRPFYQTILFWVLASAIVTGLFVWWFNQTKLKNQKRLLAQQAALINERNRITSDLHDDVGASLSSLQIHSVIARQVMESDKEKAKNYLDKIIRQSADISSNISDIIWSMKSQEDRLVDMDGRIRNTVSNLLGATNINYVINIETPLENLLQNITARKNIMLIIKEAINNCAKYSKATECNLFLKFDKKNLVIKINDNGEGIAANKMKVGNGLQNMRKRSKELNGIMELSTAENKGVQLEFTIPATEIRG